MLIFVQYQLCRDYLNLTGIPNNTPMLDPPHLSISWRWLDMIRPLDGAIKDQWFTLRLFPTTWAPAKPVLNRFQASTNFKRGWAGPRANGQRRGGSQGSTWLSERASRVFECTRLELVRFFMEEKSSLRDTVTWELWRGMWGGEEEEKERCC